MTPAEQARLELLEVFREEAQDRINKINFSWITLEKKPDDEQAAEELLRQLHTLKGEAKMMGFADMGLLVHRTEELVLFARGNRFEVPAAFGDLIMASADGLSALLHKRAGSTEPGLDLAALFLRFDELLAEAGGRRAEDPGPKPEPMPVTTAMPVVAKPALRRAGVEAERFLRVDVESVGAFSLAASETVIAHTRYRHSIRTLRRLSAELTQDLKRLDRLESGNGGGASAREQIATAALRRFQGELDGVVDALREQVNEGSVHASELEHRVRHLRLVPVAPLFKRFARAVRDLASEHGKQVSVDLLDRGVTLDKIVVDKIADPLLHLIRNSVDHGLEGPEERVAAGKPETGTVVLAAEQQGGYGVITVSDDGRGVDRERVKTRAVAVGLLSAQAADALSDEELLALLFVAGFSTRETTSETSGRGVGLDVVKHQIELLGGSVRIDSPPEGGTLFELRVPISVALTRVLVVEAGGRPFAIPSAAVEQVMVLDEGDVEMVNNRRAVRFHDERLPLRELAGVLDIEEPAARLARAVILSYEGSRVAAVVSACRSDVDVIVKPLGDLLANTRLFSGACTLEEGSLGLVLNPAELVPRARQESPWVRPAATTKLAQRQRRILFSEDSGITRAMVARTLRILGYDVREAEDGAQALEHLEKESFDLILTDIDMPNVNGLELVERVRAQERWRNLPIVMLTTHGSDEDKRRAAEAGADAYMVKTEFSEAVLREVIGKQLGL